MRQVVRTPGCLLALLVASGVGAVPARGAAPPPLPRLEVVEQPPELAPSMAPSELFALVLHEPVRLEEALRSSFSRLLGTPAELQVDLQWGRASRRLGGHFERILVHFRGGALDKLAIAEATLEARDVHYDLEALLTGATYVPRSVGSTRLDLTVTEEALNQAIGATRGRLGVRSPRFALSPGELRFTGSIQVLFFHNDLDLSGSLRVQGGSEIHFRPHRMRVSRVPVPGFVVRALTRRCNPVVDLGRAPFWKSFKAELGSIELGEGTLRVRTRPPPGVAAPEHETGPIPLAGPLVAPATEPGDEGEEADDVVPFGAL